MFRAVLLAVTATAVAALAPTASAATPAKADPVGSVTVATQDTFAHRLRVDGWAYDRTASTSTVTVRIYADGHLVGRVRTTRPTPALDRSRHLTGTHGFTLTVSFTRTVGAVTITSDAGVTLASKRATHTQPPAAERVIAVAKRYVGHARYVEGGNSPKHGFDCSGYTQYVFATAKAGTLPHNAEAQRRMKRMHAVSARTARAGDLVFYGSPAYHVAIYAGHGMQYAAATPRDGIRYQHVWSSDVHYGRYR